MRARHIILMLIKASGGSIATKTRIQKGMYFLSLSLGKDFGFRAHYYGPYSVEVEKGLEELIGAGFVEMRQTFFGVGGNRGFEFKRYDFSLTESGQSLADAVIEKHRDEYQIVDNFVRTLGRVGDPDYLSLSVAAKAYYILDKEAQSMNLQRIKAKAAKLGWRVEKQNIKEAIEILQGLGLISVCSQS